MRLTSAIVLLVLAGNVRIAGAEDRFPPLEVRRKAIGCWRLAKDQRLVITAFGRHSIMARLTGAVTTAPDVAPWHADENSFVVPCARRANQADYTCRVAPEGNQLRMKVFQLVPNSAPRTIEDIAASRCAT